MTLTEVERNILKTQVQETIAMVIEKMGARHDYRDVLILAASMIYGEVFFREEEGEAECMKLFRAVLDEARSWMAELNASRLAYQVKPNVFNMKGSA
jgi:hypothetical protein